MYNKKKKKEKLTQTFYKTNFFYCKTNVFDQCNEESENNLHFNRL